MKKGMRLIIAGLLVLPLAGCSKEKMELANKEVTVEYGQTISTDVKDYLKNDSEFLKDVKMEGIPDNEQDKEYPGIGEYEITLKNDDEQQKVKISVKDTVAPVFKEIKDSYELKYEDKFDVNSIKTEDLSKVELSIVGDVDYKKAGTYKVNVIAKDESGNETKKEISIVVKEEEKKETATTANKKTDSSQSSTTSGSTSKKSNNGSTSSSSTTKKSNSSSTSSNKTTDEKTSGSGSSSTSTKKNDDESYTMELTPIGYRCLGRDNCQAYFKTEEEMNKHLEETGHGGYGIDFERIWD